MQLGSTTITFGGTIEQKLSAIADAGFSTVELWPKDLFENVEGPEFVLRWLERTGLVVSVYQALRNYEGTAGESLSAKLEVARQMMDQMDLVGCDTLVVAASSDPVSSADIRVRAGHLRRLGDLAGKRGKRIAFETIAWATHENRLERSAELIDAVGHPAVGHMVDSFHLFALDAPMACLATLPRARIFHVEIADMAGTQLPLIDVSRNYRLFPGEGVGDVAGFMTALKNTGYDDGITVEIFNAAYRLAPALDVARRSYKALEGCVGQCQSNVT